MKTVKIRIVSVIMILSLTALPGVADLKPKGKVLQRFEILISPREVKTKVAGPVVHVFQYNPDQYKINSEARTVLQGLDLRSGVKVHITGHTDNEGPYLYNLWLSWKRAEQIQKFLNTIYPGIVATTKSMGFQRPLGNNKTPEGRAANRRVIIEIMP